MMLDNREEGTKSLQRVLEDQMQAVKQDDSTA